MKFKLYTGYIGTREHSRHTARARADECFFLADYSNARKKFSVQATTEMQKAPLPTQTRTA